MDAWSYIPTPQYVFVVWYLVKHKEKLSFAFTLLYSSAQVSQGNSFNVYMNTSL
jgi:hypothetical protein